MVRAAVIGATGYTGLELVRILLSHPAVEVTVLTSKRTPQTPFSDIFPALKGLTNISTVRFDPDYVAERSDVAFTALPHCSSMRIAASLIGMDLKVIDLSADFRFRDISVYNEWYGEHSSPQLAGEAVYGLPELNRSEIKRARLVANPGCYPTSAILPLAPLLREGVIDPGTIVINSASGVSGAGRSASIGTMFCEVNEGFRAYKVGEHRHTPEIEEVLKASTGEEIRVTFTPHLAPINRGILSTITATLKKGLSTADVLKTVGEFYEGDIFVRVCREGVYPDSSGVRGSNYCDIGARVDERTGRVILVSAIDNLVKGASGQAVQNMNIIFGLDEDEGLRHIPLNI